MSVLSEREIIRSLGRDIIVLPFEDREHNLRGCDIKLTASEYAYIFENGSPRCIAQAGVLTIPPHKTAIVWTEEFIYINDSLCGSLHSKVKLVSNGLGHIGTRVNPKWKGILAIALHNHSGVDVQVRVGDVIAYLRLHKLTSKSDIESEKGGKLDDAIPDRYTAPLALKNWVDDRQKTWQAISVEAALKEYRNHKPYVDARKEYEPIWRSPTRFTESQWLIIIGFIAAIAAVFQAIAAFYPKR